MKIEYEVWQIAMLTAGILLAGLFIGMALGKNLYVSHLDNPKVDANYCIAKMGNMSQTFMQAIVSVSQLDAEKVFQSYEYCAMINNNTEILDLIRNCSIEQSEDGGRVNSAQLK